MLIKLDNKEEIVKFHFQPNKRLLETLGQRMNVLSFLKLKFFGFLKLESKSRWNLNGQLVFMVRQECVVTLEPVVSKVKSTVKRVYVDKGFLNVNRKTDGNISEDDYEEFEGAIDLVPLLFEEISLTTPEYPKVNDIDKIRVATEKTIDSTENLENNPFAILKNFGTSNKISSN